MVAPVKASNSPPSFFTAQLASLSAVRVRPTKLSIQLDFFSSILSPRPGVSLWVSTRTALTAPLASVPTTMRMAPL
ncbi:hypothetical protein D3C79_966240 [compost metagenome]